MAQPTAREIIPMITATGLATYIGYDLADHHVGVSVIVSVVLALLSTGLSLGSRFQQAATTHLYSCPETGCGVEIRATNRPADRLARLQKLATDHTRHTENAA